MRKRFRCPDCGIRAGAQKLEYSKEEVQAILDEANSGYVIIGEYTKAGDKVLCRCKNGHEFQLVFSQWKQHRSGCRQCAIDANKGPNNPNWNGGGHQEVMDMLRHYIKPWKKKCLEKAKYRCDILGTGGYVLVHHLHNFSDIVKQASQNTGIPILNKVADYNYEDRLALSEEVMRLHEISNGVVMDAQLHNQFHNIYGRTNNTAEQYYEFKNHILS